MLRKIFRRGIHFFKLGFSFFKSAEPYISDKTILLINGDVDFCRLHGKALQKQGFKVLFAHTLESGRLQLMSDNPHIILLDHKMPDGSGIGFLEKNQLVLEEKAVILMTEETSIESTVIAMKSGTIEILRKPFQSTSLNKIVYLAVNFSSHKETSVL